MPTFFFGVDPDRSEGSNANSSAKILESNFAQWPSEAVRDILRAAHVNRSDDIRPEIFANKVIASVNMFGSPWYHFGASPILCGCVVIE